MVFQNLVARDLNWVMASPPILTGVERFPQYSDEACEELQRGFFDAAMHLEGLDKPAAMAALGFDDWRVGFYFEALMAYGVSHLPGWTLLGTNVEIRDHQRTLGALDLVVRRPDGLVEHWEIAVKFYLLCGDAGRLDNWYGPNQRDRLDKKLNRMRNHQLELSRRRDAKRVLNKLGVSDVHRRVGWMKGMLFTEWKLPNQGPPNCVEPPKGRWVDGAMIDGLVEAHPASRWILRKKPYWLSDVLGADTHATMVKRPTVAKRPQMWSRMTGDDAGNWHEAERWFVVPADWRRNCRNR